LAGCGSPFRGIARGLRQRQHQRMTHPSILVSTMTDEEREAWMASVHPDVAAIAAAYLALKASQDALKLDEAPGGAPAGGGDGQCV